MDRILIAIIRKKYTMAVVIADDVVFNCIIRACVIDIYAVPAAPLIVVLYDVVSDYTMVFCSSSTEMLLRLPIALDIPRLLHRSS